jgi:hypothetical protein
LWFNDRVDFLNGMSYLKDKKLTKRIADDEERVFDRASIRFVAADDFESLLAKV